MKKSFVALLLMGMNSIVHADGIQSLSVQVYEDVDLKSGAADLPQPQIEQTTIDRSGRQVISQTLDYNGKHLSITASPGADSQHRKVAIETVMKGEDANGIETRVTKKSSMVVAVGKPGLMQIFNDGFAIGVCVAPVAQCPSIQVGSNR